MPIDFTDAASDVSSKSFDINLLEVCRAGGIGDILMCTPGLREFKKRHPTTKIRFYAAHSELLYGLAYIDEVRPFESRSSDSIWLNYETLPSPTEHIAKVFARQLNLKIQDVRPDCAAFDDICNRWRSAWAGMPRPWITVNRHASNWSPNKDWPSRNWDALLNHLDRKCGVIEIGSRRDNETAFAGQTSVDLVGKTTLAELVAAIAVSDMHIGPISGPVHIAAAYRKPSVVIYGGYEPAACTMYAGNYALQPAIECSPCWLTDSCPHDLKCLSVISVDQVINAVWDTWHNADAHASSSKNRFRSRMIKPPCEASEDSMHDAFELESRVYVSYRPDSDFLYHRFPELKFLADKWIMGNVENNCGDIPRLYLLALNVKQILNDGIAGEFAELGVYKGNSAAILAHYARNAERTTYLFDTFEGFDPKDLNGVDVSKPNSFRDASVEMVLNNTGKSAVRCVKGRFPESITSDHTQLSFALVHLDCDLFEPMKAGLDFFYPRLAPGGILIIHDYVNEYWNGVKVAVDEFCKLIPEQPVVMPDKSGTAIIRKCRAISPTA